MKKYSIIEVINSGTTDTSSGNDATEFFSLRLTPKQDNPLEFGDGTSCVLNVFENEQPALVKSLKENQDNEEVLNKIALRIVVREYTSEVPFYVTDSDGNRRTYKNPKHKDSGKDVVANKIKVVILDTGDEETNDVRCEEAFSRQLSKLQRDDMLVDLKDPDVMKYEDFKARKVLGLVSSTDDDTTTE